MERLHRAIWAYGPLALRASYAIGLWPIGHGPTAHWTSLRLASQCLPTVSHKEVILAIRT